MQGANNRLPRCLNGIALRRFSETETSSSSLNRDAKSWPRGASWSSLRALMLSGILPTMVHRKLVCRAVYTMLDRRNVVGSTWTEFNWCLCESPRSRALSSVLKWTSGLVLTNLSPLYMCPACYLLSRYACEETIHVSFGSCLWLLPSPLTTC